MRNQPPGHHRHAPEGAGVDHLDGSEFVGLSGSDGAGMPRHCGVRHCLLRAVQSGLRRRPSDEALRQPAGHQQLLHVVRTWQHLECSISPQYRVWSKPRVHREPGNGEPLLLHAVPAERSSAAGWIRRGGRLLQLRQPQLLQLLHRLVRIDALHRRRSGGAGVRLDSDQQGSARHGLDSGSRHERPRQLSG